MSEPSFIRQGSGLHRPEARQEWIRRQVELSKDEGCTFFRATVHEEKPDLLLYEAWIKQPQDQGEQRWLPEAGAE